MSNKVTIIGAGSVGSTIAYTMTVKGIASEIVLIDINAEKALGEAMDIKQGTPFCCPVTVNSGTYEDAKGSDIVIVSSGLPRKPGQSRLDLAQTNVNIIKEIAPEIAKYAPDALYILVSNPVDILTYAFMKYSGLPREQNYRIGNDSGHGASSLLSFRLFRSQSAEYSCICNGRAWRFLIYTMVTGKGRRNRHRGLLQRRQIQREKYN